jgi:hypothetical protein
MGLGISIVTGICIARRDRSRAQLAMRATCAPSFRSAATAWSIRKGKYLSAAGAREPSSIWRRR